VCDFIKIQLTANRCTDVQGHTHTDSVACGVDDWLLFTLPMDSVACDIDDWLPTTHDSETEEVPRVINDVTPRYCNRDPVKCYHITTVNFHSLHYKPYRENKG